MDFELMLERLRARLIVIGVAYRMLARSYLRCNAGRGSTIRANAGRLLARAEVG